MKTKFFKFIKRFLLSAVVLFCASNAFSEDWFICLSSFKSQQNAVSFQNELSVNGIKTFITEAEVDDVTYYRVLFDEAFATVKYANKRKAELDENPVLKNKVKGDFWLCKASRDDEVVHITLKPVDSVIENVIPVEESKTDEVAAVIEVADTVKEAAAIIVTEPVAAENKELPVEKEAIVEQESAVENAESEMKEADAEQVTEPVMEAAETPAEEEAVLSENEAPVEDEAGLSENEAEEEVEETPAIIPAPVDIHSLSVDDNSSEVVIETDDESAEVETGIEVEIEITEDAEDAADEKVVTVPAAEETAAEEVQPEQSAETMEAAEEEDGFQIFPQVANTEQNEELYTDFIEKLKSEESPVEVFPIEAAENKQAEVKAALDSLKNNLAEIPGMKIKMLKTEVTQKIYESVMESNPSSFAGDNNPVENVSWYDAVYFCNKASELAGLTPVYSVNGSTNVKDWNYIPHHGASIEDAVLQNAEADGYRLPSVEEWEYAAKGGKSWKYSGSSSLNKVGFYKENSGSSTQPCGGKEDNDYGLYDMSGNVWEWCWDTDSLNDKAHVYCGGAWDSMEYSCAVKSRDSFNGYFLSSNLGFRVVCGE